MALEDTKKLLRAVLEASLYVSPTEPGLTSAELYEVGKRLGLGEGEIGDALPHVTQQYFGQRNVRLQLETVYWHTAGHLTFREDPDLRNERAFDFVIGELNQLAKQFGSAQAQLDRGVLVERAVASSIQRHDIEVAIALLVLSDQLLEQNGVLKFKHQQLGEHALPSSGRRQDSGPAHSKSLRTKAMPHVRDVIARRTDNRPKHAEPLDDFGARLDGIGFGQFGLWWRQTVAEMGRSDPASSPLSALVLSAALVEGALTFAASYARGRSLTEFSTNDLAGDTKSWTLERLLKAAAHNNVVLDAQTKNRADGLILTRQRIHAGRLLSSQPKGRPIPDLRPEEAREAKAVAEQVVRFILEWLHRNTD